MSFSFDFTVKNVRTAFDKAKRAGLKITGEKRGTFNQSGVSGSYVVEGKTIHVKIDKKPGLVTQRFIEKKVQAFFS